MCDDDLNGFHASINQIGHEADSIGDVAGKNKDSIKARPSAASMKGVLKEDLAKIFLNEGAEGQTPLSETFIDQATILFEAAVATRVAVEVEALEEDANEQVEVATSKTIQEMSERLDKYLDYIAEEYLEQNQLAIEAGIRSELSESFIAGIKQLFEEHNVDVPDADIDVIGGLNEEIKILKEQLNEKTSMIVEQREDKASQYVKYVIDELSEGMTELDKDRFALVIESTEYTDPDELREKAVLIAEKLFTKSESGQRGLIIEEVAVDNGILSEAVEQTEQLSPKMSRYVDAIKRTNRD
jgi:hypothetical protein